MCCVVGGSLSEGKNPPFNPLDWLIVPFYAKSPLIVFILRVQLIFRGLHSNNGLGCSMVMQPITNV